jgi:hypothetical protein
MLGGHADISGRPLRAYGAPVERPVGSNQATALILLTPRFARLSVLACDGPNAKG